MAAMVVAMAVPAFADHFEGRVGGNGGMCDNLVDPDTGYNTRSTQDGATGAVTISGGGGGPTGGSGSHCDLYVFTGEVACVGKGY